MIALARMLCLWAVATVLWLSGGAVPVTQGATVPMVLAQASSPPASGVAFSTLGPLAEKVTSGQAGAWMARDDTGRLVLSNQASAGAVRFYGTNWQGDLDTGRSIGVRVLATGSGALSAGGIVFRIADGDPRWLAFVVTSDGKLASYVRRPNELKRVGLFDISGGHRPEGDLLQINQKGNTAQLLANGRLVTELTPEDGSTLPAPVGIIALGMGTFTFDKFAFGPFVTPARTQDGGNDDTVPTPTVGDDNVPPVTRPEVPAPKMPPKPPKVQTTLKSFTPDTFGAAFGIMAHEFGHFMIGELKIPATGPEEDVADEFAAMVFIDNFKENPQTSMALALGNARLWWYMAEDRGDKNPPPFYDEHAPDRARFAKFSCMLYGASPDNFGRLMDDAGIPDRSKQRCVMDEPKRHAAWDALLRPLRRRGVAPNIPGDIDPSTPGHKIEVVYEEPKNPAMKPFADEIRNSGVFDAIADGITKLYVLPRDTKLVFRDCDVENCFYRPDDGSVTMCWEMINFVMEQFRKKGQGQGPNPGPTPQPNNGGPSVSLEQFLAGRWRSRSSANGTSEDTLLELGTQGTYQAQVQTQTQQGFIMLNVQGQWEVTPAGGATVQLTLDPQQWYPQQMCQQGFCTPINLQTKTWMIQIVDKNTIRSNEGVATRIQ